MIIFGNRAHYSAIGGVENSIRSMVSVASQERQGVTIVCREPILNESLDSECLGLPSSVGLVMYKDEYNRSILRRLLFLRHGGEVLPSVYRNLYAKFPDAVVIVRHHMHVLAASRAGFSDIRYLVPSLTVNQLRSELAGASVVNRLRIMCHMMIDGWLQSKALAMAKLFVFSSSMQDQVRQSLSKRHQGNSIKLVKPGIDSSRFKPASTMEKQYLRERLGLPKERKLFLFVGRFVKAKGLDYLLDAFVTLPKDCSIVLVGGGDLESFMLDKVRSLGIGERALLVGRTSEVELFYRACDVFVMSSVYEPLGQTILEAAACGMRIAAYGPSTGIITSTHELGLDEVIDYADKLDVESLALSMRQAMSLVKSEDSMCHAGFIPQRYSWSKLLDQLTG